MKGITGCLVEPRPAKHIERLDEFIRFAAKFKLRALSTFPTNDTPQRPTTWRNTTGTEIQMNYIFISENLAGEALVDRTTKLKSDHLLILATISGTVSSEVSPSVTSIL